MYERADVELRGCGAGVGTHQELIDAMTEAGADTQNLGAHITDRVALDARAATAPPRPAPCSSGWPEPTARRPLASEATPRSEEITMTANASSDLSDEIRMKIAA